MATPKQFAARLRAIAKGIPEKIEEGFRKVALIIDQKVVLATPVDTGRARSNWIVSLNKPVTQTIEARVPGTDGSSGGANAQAAIQQGRAAVAGFKRGQTIWIVNSLPYIGELNRGTSAQAPANFVEIAVRAGIAEARRIRILTS